jgi:hypothetical protein
LRSKMFSLQRGWKKQLINSEWVFFIRPNDWPTIFPDSDLMRGKK